MPDTKIMRLFVLISFFSGFIFGYMSRSLRTNTLTLVVEPPLGGMVYTNEVPLDELLQYFTTNPPMLIMGTATNCIQEIKQ